LKIENKLQIDVRE